MQAASAGLCRVLQVASEILDRPGKALIQLCGRLPLQALLCERYVRLALNRIVAGQWHEHQFGLRSDELNDSVGKLEHRELARIADVHRAYEIVWRAHE